jgi:nicotinamidase-related amidase
MKSTFKPENTALILIDHQIGTMQLIKNLPLTLVKSHIIALAKTAKILDIPVVLTSSQEERIQGPLMPELEQLLPLEFKARTRRAGIANAWADPAFREAIHATGKRNLILAGVTTSVCLVFPAIDAVNDGFNVQAVMDASGSPSDIAEEMARQRMRDAGVVLTATDTVLAELGKDWSSAHGQKIIQVMFENVLPPIVQ